MKRHVFETYHPAVLLLYLVAAAALSMVSMHPVFLGISLICGCAYAAVLKGARKFLRASWFFALFALAVALCNPLFGGSGATLLFYIGSRPVTVEALWYGGCAGMMLLSVLVWFQCWQELMTSDRFYCLFGRILPIAAMTVSMTLRFIPLVARRGAEISFAQKALVGQRGEAEPIALAEPDPPNAACTAMCAGMPRKRQGVRAAAESGDRGTAAQQDLCKADADVRRGIEEKAPKKSQDKLRLKKAGANAGVRRGIEEKTSERSQNKLRLKKAGANAGARRGIEENASKKLQSKLRLKKAGANAGARRGIEEKASKKLQSKLRLKKAGANAGARRGIEEKASKKLQSKLRLKKAGAKAGVRRGIEEKASKKTQNKLRLKNLTVLVGMTMEDAIETADAMRARGYSGMRRKKGPARTAWQSRPLRAGDWALLVLFGALAAFSAGMMVLFRARFYPKMAIPALPVWAAAPYALLLLFPLLIEGRDRLLWRRSRL